jgi:hypothetical protein
MGHRRKMTRADLIVLIGCVVLALLTLGAAGESARRLAQELVCLGNQEVLTGAWLAYADDNDGALVSGHTGPGRWVEHTSSSASVEQRFDAIREGLLFPYVGDVNTYHCPADQALNDPNYPVFRTYSIAGGANGEDWASYTKAEVYSDLESPATQYIFVEVANPRGCNIGSWQMQPRAGNPSWTDPLAMWHEESTTLGFADGHAEVRRWHDESLIDWCHRAMERRGFTFNMTPPDDEQEDVEYMAQGFPYKSLR